MKRIKGLAIAGSLLVVGALLILVLVSVRSLENRVTTLETLTPVDEFAAVVGTGPTVYLYPCLKDKDKVRLVGGYTQFQFSKEGQVQVLNTECSLPSSIIFFPIMVQGSLDIEEFDRILVIGPTGLPSDNTIEMVPRGEMRIENLQPGLTHLTFK